MADKNRYKIFICIFIHINIEDKFELNKVIVSLSSKEVKQTVNKLEAVTRLDLDVVLASAVRTSSSRIIPAESRRPLQLSAHVRRPP